MNKKNNRIMILGASILQLPAILKAKEMGLQVIAVDMDKDAIGFEKADISLVISTIDIEKVVAAAKKYEIDCIMTLASDMPMRTVAAVAKELKIIGINEDTALNVTNKALMRKCLQEHNVPVPIFNNVDNYTDFTKAVQEIKGKIIVKPADNSGSRGVFLITDKTNNENCKYAFDYSKKYSRSGEIVVEEYMEGPEVSVETLSVNGSLHVIAITDKLTTGAPRFVEMGHSQPSMLPDNMKRQIELVTAHAVKAVGIMDGPAHTEIIVTNQGPKVVEIGARLGGDSITTKLVPLSTGIDMVKSCIEIAMGNKPQLIRKPSKGSVIRYIQGPKGRISKINGVEKALEIEGVNQIFFMKNIGDNIVDVMSSVDRVGFIISQSTDVMKAIKICEKVRDCIEICVQEEEC